MERRPWEPRVDERKWFTAVKLPLAVDLAGRDLSEGHTKQDQRDLVSQATSKKSHGALSLVSLDFLLLIRTRVLPPSPRPLHAFSCSQHQHQNLAHNSPQNLASNSKRDNEQFRSSELLMDIAPYRASYFSKRSLY